ncbi:MAG: hypothetical protein P4L81_08205, partial [Candidatus Pacebacteria bacterium]|nr:hypothetical protein [Candidatus Paceibacterota bacterium]
NGWLPDMQNVAEEIASTFGEPLKLIPCDRRPNCQARADPSNAVEVQGVFSWRAKMVFKLNNGTSSGQDGLAESREPIASFPRAALPWAVRLGDQVERLCGGNLFEVKSAEPDGVSMIVLKLLQLGRSNQ